MATFVTEETEKGQVSKIDNALWRKRGVFNAGSPVGDITDQDLGELGGALYNIRAKFGTTAPNSLTITIKDDDGITLATGTLTESGSITIDSPVLFVGGLSISISGNTTVNATATISLYFF